MITGSVFGIGLLYSALFAVPAALLITAYTHLFLPRIGMLLAGATTIGIAVFYGIQIVSFERYGMLLTPGVSLKELVPLMTALRNCAVPLLALLVPFLVWFLLIGHFTFYYPSRRILAAGLLLGVITHGIGLAATLPGGMGEGTPFALYFKTSSPVQSAKVLGVGTTFRLETERRLFGISASPAKTETEGSGEQQEESSRYDENLYNITDIDFDALLTTLGGRISALSERTGEEETPALLQDCQQLLSLDTYFNDRLPTKKNDHTGRYQGYHLIYITTESLAPYAIDEKRTPTLYQMWNEGYQFENFYAADWEDSTADGEFLQLFSLYPEQGGEINSLAQAADRKLPFAPGNLLTAQGYQSYAYYGGVFDDDGRNKTYPALGYSYRGTVEEDPGSDGQAKETRVSDTQLISETMSDYLSEKQFHVHYMTVSGKAPYSFSENAAAAKHKDAVSGLKYSEGSKAYLASVVELDKALEQLLAALEEAGVAERTIIAVAPAHSPELTDEQLTELRGEEPKDAFDRAESSFLLYVPGQKSEKVSVPCSGADILPTLYNLMGLSYDSRLMLGTDVFSGSTPTVVLEDGSWISTQVKYNAEIDEASLYSAAEGENAGSGVNEATKDTVSEQIKRMQEISVQLMGIDYFTHLGK
ncbi:MAG: LTA synthase family protein [Butyricicoccaceae bacterium]